MERPFPFSEIESIWMNGALVPFEDATVHVLAHVVHYGSAVFEGIRAYDTPAGPAVFRLDAHLERLVRSCKIYRMDLGLGVAGLTDAVLTTLRANRLRAAYVRPVAFRGFRSIRMDPLPCPVELVIATWPTKGKFLADDVLEKGIAVGVSSWRRPSAASLPLIAKGAGHYLSSQLITMEAHANGYAEGLALDADGNLSEGATDNLFLVDRGMLYTPPVGASILEGITRDCIITLARDMGLEVHERVLPRAMLYTCDEAFITGTSVEISPITSVDRIPVGTGEPGPITRRLIDAFDDVARGRTEDRWGWLTPVYPDGDAPHPEAGE